MTGAFEFLNKIFEFLWQFMPKPTIVDPQKQAVRTRTVRFRDLARLRWDPSAKPVAVLPGFYVFWPIVTSWIEYPVKEQTLPVVSVQFETAEVNGEPSKTVSASAILKYRVLDLVQLICENDDADDGISDMAQTAMLEVMVPMPYSEIRSGIRGRRTLDTKLRNAAKEEIEKQYGVQVTKFSLSSLTPTKVMRHIVSTRQEGELK